MQPLLLAAGSAKWIPVPHRMELFLGTEPPQPDLTTASFTMVKDNAGKLLLTHVNDPGRGWDVPGGHLDSGEAADAAAVRETMEETGLALRVDQIALLGWQQFTLHAIPPAWYKYPCPISYALYFTTSIDESEPRTDPALDGECGSAGWFSIREVRARCAGYSWLPFLSHIPEPR